MNKKQLVAMWVGLAVITAMCAYPPWMGRFEEYLVAPLGYHPLWSPPHRQEHPVWRRGYVYDKGSYACRSWGEHIDWVRLLVGVVPTVLVAAGMMVSLRSPRQ